MDEEKIIIQVGDKCSELVIRQGEAKEIKPNDPIIITGSIEAPITFLKARGKSFRPADSFVTVNRAKMEVELHFNEDKQFGAVFEAVIIGKMKENPDLTEFGINKNRVFQLTELSDLLKRNRFFFIDKAQNAKVVSDLRAFKAKITSDLTQQSDTRGNKQISMDKKVDGNVPFQFTLAMPIFVGGATKTFEVEICLETRDAGVTVWLESPELQDIILTEREDTLGRIKTELCTDPRLAVIEI